MWSKGGGGQRRLVPAIECGGYVCVDGYYIVRLDEGERNCVREAKWLENNGRDGGGREGGSGMLEGRRGSRQPV